MGCLLDKNLVRYILNGLYHGRSRPLSPLELSALSLWRTAEEQGVPLYISRYTYNVLQRLRTYVIAQIVLDTMPALAPTRYHARWARRVRETAGMTHEDAAMVALASFGNNDAEDLVHIQWLATCDQLLVNGYRAVLPTLERRFQAMTAQLPPPFCQAALPQVIAPDSLMTLWLR